MVGSGAAAAAAASSVVDGRLLLLLLLDAAVTEHAIIVALSVDIVRCSRQTVRHRDDLQIYTL